MCGTRAHRVGGDTMIMLYIKNSQSRRLVVKMPVVQVASNHGKGACRVCVSRKTVSYTVWQAPVSSQNVATYYLRAISTQYNHCIS